MRMCLDQPLQQAQMFRVRENQPWCSNMPLSTEGMSPSCYVLVEHSAQCEWDGYNFDTLHVVLEACASDTL